MLSKIFVANRGEIAVRIIRAAQELNIACVLGHSAVDVDSLAARLADETIEIGPAQAGKSYLDIARVIAAAKASRADAVHPGYGFLSENAAFAQAVMDAGMVFIGPTPQTISLMGDKARARETAMAAGVPTVPGSTGIIADAQQALAVAEVVGYPVMLKAAAGGGGRGIRVAGDATQLSDLFMAASREALAAFGDGGLYLERFIARARHIEVQILGDGKSVVHCYDRECSLQRRRQKVWEEAPSPSLNDEQRERICASAVALAKQVNYSGAGTLEYLFDGATGEFFFIEMNTRIQVEHPVTEMVTGIDLIREMIRIAGGEPLRFKQTDIYLRGAAIECRINAEDPARDFMPSPGTVLSLQWPAGPGVRIDSMLYAGYKVPPYYDSLLGKIIVWDESRSQLLGRLKRVLCEMKLEGVASTIPLHQALVNDPAIATADYHTGFLETWLALTFSTQVSG